MKLNKALLKNDNTQQRHYQDKYIMEKRTFDVIAKEEFMFLESGYGFLLTECKKKDWGYELIYTNATTGIKVSYEYQQAYIYIVLYRLVDGKMIENSKSTEKEVSLFGCGLDDIISLRDSSALIKPAYEYGEESEYYDKKNGLTLFTSAFANNLRKYAADVLSGDFKIFEEVEKIVIERLNSYRR